MSYEMFLWTTAEYNPHSLVLDCPNPNSVNKTCNFILKAVW